MIQVKYEPYRTVTVRSCNRLDGVEGLLGSLHGHETPYWMKGVVFIFYTFPVENAYFARHVEEGELPIALVNYARMPEYQPKVKVRGIEVEIVEAEQFEVCRAIGRWLMQRREKRKGGSGGATTTTG